ncbi:MAG: hypothetical protein HC856_07140 [Pseudanabaena sp. RU_4_16]|nr:hypothetical protein [Pseudanabaena sp. RU_4_16]
MSIPKHIDGTPLEPKSKHWRYLKYFALGLITNAALWGLAAIYLKVAPPTYTSNWALILPGVGTGVNVNLPGIGQATSSSSSPFGSNSMDPRANYQFIATDEAVLKEAATSLNISLKELGKPKVKLIDNTSIVQFEVSGSSPTEAQMRSHAIVNALQNKLNRLRFEEILKREQSSQNNLKIAQAKLQKTQKQLSDYKAKSGLSSSDQIKDLSTNIEQLRKQKVESYAQVQQTTNRLEQLSSDLGLTVSEASGAFKLQADRLFQQNLKDYSESSASLVILKTKWGDNHPLVIKEVARQQATRKALLNRASSLLGRKVSQANLGQLNIKEETGSGRETLFRDLVTVQSEQKGAVAQERAIAGQIVQLETRLQNLVQKQTTLDSLQREVQIAEAVFASTLAKLDLGKSDIFASYPIAQLIAEPTLPDTASSPKPLYVFLGAGVSSLLIATGLILLWWRQEISPFGKSKMVDISNPYLGYPKDS